MYFAGPIHVKIVPDGSIHVACSVRDVNLAVINSFLIWTFGFSNQYSQELKN